MADDSKEGKRPRLDESLVCDVCGRFGAVEFGDRKLCPDCYESYGSCCPEFGREECEEPKEGAGECKAAPESPEHPTSNIEQPTSTGISS